MIYEITGEYKNGDRYDSGPLNLVEISEHLAELTDNSSDDLNERLNESDHPMLDTLHIQTYKGVK